MDSPAAGEISAEVCIPWDGSYTAARSGERSLVAPVAQITAAAVCLHTYLVCGTLCQIGERVRVFGNGYGCPVCRTGLVLQVPCGSLAIPTDSSIVRTRSSCRASGFAQLGVLRSTILSTLPVAILLVAL